MRIRYDRLMRSSRYSSPCVFPLLRPLCLALAFTAAGAVHAQKVDVSPGVDARLTWTDNARAGSSGRSDWVGEVAPSLGISRQGGRAQGRLNTRFRSIHYASESDRSNSFLTLDGRGEIEALEDLFFIEADASIRRDGLSLFTGRAGDDVFGRGRNEETRTFSLAPRLEFRLGSFADGVVGYRTRWLDGGRGNLSAARLDQWTASLSNPNALGRIGWGANYVRSRNYYDDSQIPDVTVEVARGTVFYNLSPQFRLRGVVGHEKNDFGGPRSDSGSIIGGGFDWFPTPRTAVLATVEDRLFGTGYDVSVSHRRARSSWELSYGRDLSSSLQNFGSVFSDPLFAFFYDLPQFVELYPDPLEREDVVRGFLGLTGDSFFSNAYFVDRRMRGAFSLNGVRNTLTFSVTTSDRERVSTLGGLRAEDDFFDSDRVRSRAVGLTLNHRLSGLSSLNAGLTRTTARRSGDIDQETRRLTASLGYSTRLGPRTVAGLTYRYQRANGRGGAADFTENAITANIGMRF